MISNPVGIDAKIQALQLDFTANLFTGMVYWSYGQAYRNSNGEGPVPEVFLDGRDYKEVLTDDRLDALSFFLVTGQTGDLYTVSVYFLVNLEMYNVEHRAIDEAHNEVIRRVIRSQFRPVRITQGLDAISEFEGNDETMDMHPFYCFKIDLETNVNFC